MESGTLVILNLLDQGNAPGIRAAEQSEELQQRISTLVSETNRVCRWRVRSLPEHYFCVGFTNCRFQQMAHILYDPDIGVLKNTKEVKILVLQELKYTF